MLHFLKFSSKSVDIFIPNLNLPWDIPNLYSDKEMSNVNGQCYFRNFDVFYHGENFHLISCLMFSCLPY